MPLSDARPSQRWPAPFVCVALIALLAFWLMGLGSAPLFDVDEGAFAEASREMLASGDWGHTTLNGADRFDKPILVYWFQGASLGLFGTNAFAARLPSALAAFGWCLALVAFAAPRWGRATAVAAGTMLATSMGPLLIGRAATADALLHLWLALSAFDLWRWVERGGADPAPLRRAALWMALGVLTKGPVAVLVPGAALLLWLLLSPSTSLAGLSRLQWWRRLFGDWITWAMALGVAAPWYAYALARHGQAFVDGFFLKHNLDRFSGPLEGHGGSLLYYLWVLPLLLLPWTALLLPLLRHLVPLWRDDRSRFLLLWAAFVLVFFSLSGTKLPHYVMYGIVPCVLLMAVELERSRGPGLVLAIGVAVLALLALAAAAPLLAAALQDATKDGHWQALLRAAAVAEPPSLAWLSLGALVVVGLSLLAWRRPGLRLPALCAAACLGALAWSLQALPWWGQALQGAVPELAQEARARQLALVQWHALQPSVAFYRGASAPRREPVAGEAALMRADEFQALAPERRATLEVVARRPGFVLVLQR